eukprot:8013633-Lingulodinium_polyedra.AAC.1
MVVARHLFRRAHWAQVVGAAPVDPPARAILSSAFLQLFTDKHCFCTAEGVAHRVVVAVGKPHAPCQRVPAPAEQALLHRQ